MSEPHTVSEPKKPGNRPISDIAYEIRRTWKNVYFGAEPYLAAMFTLDSVTDNYGCDDGRSVIAYFLANANTWRGDDARRIKAELNGLLKRK